jgi:hypothetical protein
LREKKGKEKELIDRKKEIALASTSVECSRSALHPLRTIRPVALSFQDAESDQSLFLSLIVSNKGEENFSIHTAPTNEIKNGQLEGDRLGKPNSAGSSIFCLAPSRF